MEFSKAVFVSGVYAPLACAAVIAIGGGLFGRRSAKAVALAGFAAALFSALWSSGRMLAGFEVSAATAWFGDFSLGGVSSVMYSLAGIVGFSAGLWAVFGPGVERIKAYLALLLFMQGGLMGMFASENILWMYAFHEFALVPTFIAMCVWGGENKRAAAMEMAVYLTLGALIALAGIIALSYAFSGGGLFNLSDLSEAVSASSAPAGRMSAIFGITAVGLGALVSLFPLHSWAPKAYTAAPTPFAMLHAGVLKKFGLYFMVQVLVPLAASGVAEWLWTVAMLALVNVIGIGLVTMAQGSLKSMVSYSSVSHMGLCFLGICTMGVLGAGGAVLIMFGHGLSVAALFIFADIIKGRFGTDDMRALGGAYRKMPVCAALFVAAVLANIGLPGFANFWGELSVFVSLWTFSPAVCALAVSGIVISAVYGLRAVACVFYGPESPAVEASGAVDISFRERLPVVVLLVALMAVGFCPKLATSGIDADLSNVPAFAGAVSVSK